MDGASKLNSLLSLQRRVQLSQGQLHRNAAPRPFTRREEAKGSESDASRDLE